MRRLALALLSCLLCVPSAHAVGWTDTDDLLPAGGRADYNIQALGPNGDAAVLWEDYSGADNVLFAAPRAPGEAFPAGARVGPETGASRDADAAIDAAGNLIVVYVVSGTGLDPTLYARVRPRGGAFGEPEPLNSPASLPSRPRIAMNAAGKAAVVWVDTAPGIDIVQSRIREPGGTFEEAKTVAPTTGFAAEVAIDGAGDVIVSYRDDGEDEQRFSAKRRASGAADFGPADLVSGDGEQELNHSLIVNEAGHALLAYTASGSARAAFANPAEDFGTAQNLGTFSNTSSPVTALDAAGNGLISWENGDHAVIVRRPVAGPAGSIDTVGGPGSYPEGLVMTPDGFAILVYTMRDEAMRTRVHASLGSFAGEFGPGDIVSPELSVSDPEIDIQPDGDALVSWMKLLGGDQIPQWRAYDRNPPRFPGLSIPATGVAGTPVGFAAGGLDTWSPFSVQWSFGDGALSPDASTSHTYTAPGIYDVSVSATDAVANAASADGKIVISEPVIQPPGTTIPVISALSLEPRRFRAFRRGRPVVGTTAAKRGTTVRYSLDVAARVIFRVQRKRGKRWRKVKGRFGVDSPAGAKQFRFSGRLRKRALRRGRYRMVARPRNGAGRGAVLRARFRVVRR